MTKQDINEKQTALDLNRHNLGSKLYLLFVIHHPLPHPYLPHVSLQQNSFMHLHNLKKYDQLFVNVNIILVTILCSRNYFSSFIEFVNFNKTNIQKLKNNIKILFSSPAGYMQGSNPSLVKVPWLYIIVYGYLLFYLS